MDRLDDELQYCELKRYFQNLTNDKSCLQLYHGFTFFSVVTKVTSSKVHQFPKLLEAARGDNVSMFCTFPIFEHVPEIFWWRHNEESFLEPDNRKRFHVQKGRGSLHILNVTFADSGMYHCKIKHQQATHGAESGSLLTVCVPPKLQKIVPVEEISENYLKFECKTTAFYPEDLGISWLKDGFKIHTGMETVKNKTVDGLYEVTSSLEDAQPVQSGAVYTCLVSHACLKVPTSVSYTFNRVPPKLQKIVPVEEISENYLKFECKTTAFYPEDLGISWLRDGFKIHTGMETVKNKTMDGLYEVTSSLEDAQPVQNGVVYTCLVSHACLKVPTSVSYTFDRGRGRNSVEANQNVQPLRKAPSEENAASAAVKLKANKGFSKHRRAEENTVYSQTKKGSEGNNLTYATLQIADSKKASTPKLQDHSTLYAGIKVAKKARI
ncbi:tyrosine-protein phosphatase non-receptor type substrate 1-like [Chiloscyllium plagiosum]|uniref:tyrosine-protein phosphatase non-receptor type substrate 1-like n=1 Tax=Chiloscyllium plagiosum TaxID=36176 RepID=UPI001CB8643E|nr:tyrosine-protein phosphatase non-receptor type substrate 1-like [Chiloscyllium plagiosum]